MNPYVLGLLVLALFFGLLVFIAALFKARRSLAKAIWEMVEEMRQDGVASVRFMNDWDDPPDRSQQCAVEVMGDWTQYNEVRYYGPTVLDALSTAHSAYLAARVVEKQKARRQHPSRI